GCSTLVTPRVITCSWPSTMRPTATPGTRCSSISSSTRRASCDRRSSWVTATLLSRCAGSCRQDSARARPSLRPAAAGHRPPRPDVWAPRRKGRHRGPRPGRESMPCGRWHAVIDMHSDILFDVVRQRDLGRRDVIRSDYGESFKKGGVTALVTAIYVDQALLPEQALRHALDQVAALLGEIDDAGGEIVLCRSAADL